MLIFGGAGLRASTYDARGAELVRWAGQRGVTLHDVGPPISDPAIQEFLTKSGVICHGRCEAAEVSALLNESLFGVLTYSFVYAAKSSVLGAYCAHGLCPIIFPDSNYPGNSLDGLEDGVNFCDGTRLLQLDFDMAAAIARNAWSWYLPHKVERHVAAITSLSSDKMFL
jgi:hypothetical protein